MDQNKINSRKRSVLFLKVLWRNCENFKVLLQNIKENQFENDEFDKYYKNVRDQEGKKSLIIAREAEIEKEKLQRKLDKERKHRAEDEKREISEMESRELAEKSEVGYTAYEGDNMTLDEQKFGNFIFSTSKTKKTLNKDMTEEEKQNYFEIIKRFAYEDEYDDTMDFDEKKPEQVKKANNISNRNTKNSTNKNNDKSRNIIKEAANETDTSGDSEIDEDKKGDMRIEKHFSKNNESGNFFYIIFLKIF